MSDASTRNTNRSRLVLGIFLIGLGALLLAANLGYALPEGWWRFYPFVFIVFGALGLIAPTRHLDRSGGMWLLATGLYCVTGVFNLFGLGWSGGWPIFVIAAGISFVLYRQRDDHSPTVER